MQFEFNRKEFPVSLLRGCRYGIPKGTLFPLVKGGVNTPTAKSACGATERRRRKFIERLNLIADAYLRGYYAFNPTEATMTGLHECKQRSG